MNITMEQLGLDDGEDVKQKRKRMKSMVASLQEYMRTYSQQSGYENYSDAIFIDDILYGLGLSLDCDKYKCAGGFEAFKAFLREYLEE